MRYYNFAIKGNKEELQEKAKIELRQYGYQNNVNRLNDYMYRTLQRGTTFFLYREEEDGFLGAFAYDDNKFTYHDACSYFRDVLNSAFGIRRFMGEPIEITMRDYYHHIQEAYRRDYHNGYSWCRDTFKDCFYEMYRWSNNEKNRTVFIRYDFSEFIVSDKPRKALPIYDKSFVDELDNIEKHKNSLEGAGNLVHYVISGRSIEAAKDMTEILAQKLLGAKRITSRRVGVIKAIHPDVAGSNSYMEDIIENNYGGMLVVDLSARFGHKPEEYLMASEYIEKLFKTYRNKCLFVFTYNIDKPGFAYYILPNLSKYGIALTLKEGSGDRKTAIGYLKSLIKKSEYAKYQSQAETFMTRFSGKTFTQTQVMEAYEQFEPWCLNENILKAYNYNPQGGFMLDRDPDRKSAYEKLQSLIGLDIVKKHINDMVANFIVDKERKKALGGDYESGAMHMVFAGNPGSAKTTVAKLFAEIARDKGVLKSGVCVERGGTDLVFDFQVRNAFVAAKGGVLFIDEAYAMVTQDSITALVQEMENNRDNVIVILAGYNGRMKDFMKKNEGLKSRIPNWIDFPDYNVDELTEIFKLMLKERGFTATKEAVLEARYIFEKAVYIDGFGNGRFVRNLIDRAARNQAVRLLSGREDAEGLEENKIFLLTKEDITMLEEGMSKEREKGSAKKELEEMIGLASAKETIKKAVANFKVNKLCMERGIQRERASLHMVFTGNPGTAKTTVARLLAEMLKDENVLPTGKFLEVGRKDLVGPCVGWTAPMVEEKFKEARGGVLFIDEAYSLCDGYDNSFGDEAINTIVQEMENHREDTIVIFAGYPQPMKEFLARNPGLKSRIAFNIEFDDYGVDELCEITKLMASKKEMTITDRAMKKLRKTYERVCGESDYGNGRFVRNILEEAEMNLAERVLEEFQDDFTKELLTTIEECDIPDGKSEEKVEERRIGFAS